MRPIAVDLFAGAGGMSLGFEQAGFDIVAAIEVDPIHAAVHEYNFPDSKVICKDISAVTGAEIRSQAKIGKRKVDLVIGGAPCQGFSLIGKRLLDDPRNKLVGEFIRIVQELDADRFVFENVKGLTLGKHRAFLDEFIQTFEALGYDIRMPWKVLNAKNYGTPQSRERLIIFGAKKGLQVPDYPVSDAYTPTVFDALGDLPDCDQFNLIDTDSVLLSSDHFGEKSAYAKTLHPLDDADWFNGHRRVWDPNLLTASMRTTHSEETQARFSSAPLGKVEPKSRFFKLDPNSVCNTLRAGTDASRGAFTAPRPIHYKFNRCVSVREMARLHGFPDWFRFHQTKWHGARQIGNSVPPPLARHIGAAVISCLKLKAGQVREFAPPPIDLLKFNGTEAAKYYQSDIIIRRSTLT